MVEDIVTFLEYMTGSDGSVWIQVFGPQGPKKTLFINK